MTNIDRYREQHPDAHFLYRYFNDGAREGHRLLYVGITNDIDRRFLEHARLSRWCATYPVTRMTLEIFPTKEAAHRAERKAIEDEIPCHNTDWNANRHLTHDFGDCPSYQIENNAADLRAAVGVLDAAYARTP